MKTKFYTVLSLFFAYVGHAQQSNQNDTTYWSTGGFTTLTFSQVTLENWAAGGEPSVAINGSVDLFADYKRDRSIWENSLNLGYGLVRQGRKEEADLIKSNDIINLNTKYGYQISPTNDNWYLSGLLDFRTQFTEGRDPESDSVISRFMAPGYLTAGIGIDYKPVPVFSINYTPIAGKFTFVNDEKLANAGAYGVDRGSKFRAELGSYLRMKFKDEILKNVTLESRLELFSNYLEEFGVIDVNWQNGLMMKVNDLLTVNFSTHLIYDKDIELGEDMESKVQFKSVFGAGFAYSFGDWNDKNQEQ